MISDNKLIYNMENVRRGLPITADIFLTNYCNNRCGYCAYGPLEGIADRATLYESSGL